MKNGTRLRVLRKRSIEIKEGNRERRRKIIERDKEVKGE